MIFCPECGRIAEWNAYFKREMCLSKNCNWRSERKVIKYKRITEEEYYNLLKRIDKLEKRSSHEWNNSDLEDLFNKMNDLKIKIHNSRLD